MKIFIDTNVLIDLICQREGYDLAGKILALGESSRYLLYTSVLSIANVAYILRKVLKGGVLYQTMGKLSERMHISSMTQDDFDRAVALKASDFEDALQYYSALQAGCEAIITRNKKDFLFSEISVYTPTEFLSKVDM